jgi:small subunit ribosomal protein S18
MARNNDRDRERSPKRILKEVRPHAKKKICVFCKDSVTWVDYKEIGMLRRFVSDRGKIRSRRVSGNCTQHQRDVQVAVKTARELALLPYSQRAVSERTPGRTPRSAQPERTDEHIRSEYEDLDDYEATLAGVSSAANSEEA